MVSVVRIYIRKVRVTHSSILIPLLHRVDGLRKLCAAALVDAAGIDPEEFQVLTQRLLTALFDLVKSRFGTVLVSLHVRETDHFMFPSM